jgi:hypothetical protein
MSVSMSDSEEHLKKAEELYDQFVEYVEQLGYDHPFPPKLLEFSLEELGINTSVDADMRRILGPFAIEPRKKSNNDSHISQSKSRHDQTTRPNSLAPQIFNDVGEIPLGLLKRTFASHLGLFVPVRDFKENLDLLQEGDQHYLWNVSERAIRLVALAHKNSRHAVSEYTWEADLRDQLFGEMRDDPRISM